MHEKYGIYENIKHKDILSLFSMMGMESDFVLSFTVNEMSMFLFNFHLTPPILTCTYT